MSEKRPRGRPRNDGFPVGTRPPPPPPSGKEAAELAMEGLRSRIKGFQDSRSKQPAQSMSLLYRESRRIARVCSPEMMWGLVELACSSPDDRVRLLALNSVLDRGGVMPAPYDPDEDRKNLHAIPLAERKARMEMLMKRAQEILQIQADD